MYNALRCFLTLSIRIDGLLDLGLQRAVMDGLLDQAFSPDFVCPSTECRWPKLQTIAVCTQCDDITSQLNETCVCYDGPGTSTKNPKACAKGQINTRQECTYRTIEKILFAKTLLSLDLQEIPPVDLALCRIASFDKQRAGIS